MRLPVLRVNVPDHGACSPLCADERILAPHEIQITSPQQAVIFFLSDKRQSLHRQRAPHDAIPGSERRLPQQSGHLYQRPPFWNQAAQGLLSLLPGFQQMRQRIVFIAEQRNIPSKEQSQS